VRFESSNLEAFELHSLQHHHHSTLESIARRERYKMAKTKNMKGKHAAKGPLRKAPYVKPDPTKPKDERHSSPKRIAFY
jgi:hypothetical protein